jgi:hypothetical protein
VAALSVAIAPPVSGCVQAYPEEAWYENGTAQSDVTERQLLRCSFNYSCLQVYGTVSLTETCLQGETGPRVVKMLIVRFRRARASSIRG